MSRKIKVVLIIGIAAAAALSFYFFGGKVGGGLVFTGQLSDIFQEFSGRIKPDRVIWLDGQSESPADSSREEFSGKSSAVSFCRFSSEKKSTNNRIAINEVAWMGSVANSDAEWAELKNISGESADLSGYQLIDKAEQIKFVFSKKTVLPAGGFYLLAREKQGIAADAFYSGILSNNNEGLRLFDSDCGAISEVLAEKKWPAGDNESKRTMERDSTGLWKTSLAAGGTPGRENSILTAIIEAASAPSLPAATSIPIVSEDPAPAVQQEEVRALPIQNQQTPVQPAENGQEPILPAAQDQSPVQEPPAPQPPVILRPVLINEIMAGKDGNADYEFIELYNPNDSVFDLTGWSLKKKNSKGSESALATASRLEGKSVPARGYFLLANEEGYSGSPAVDVNWPKSYTLAYSNYALIIYDPNGQKKEEVGWIEIFKDKSYERRSAENSEFFIQDSPNPQNSN